VLRNLFGVRLERQYRQYEKAAEGG